MLEYKNRQVEVWPARGEVKVIKEGTPLDGKHFFRKKEYQKVFDELRNQRHLDTYYKDDYDRFHFLFLNGCEKIYSREDIKRMAYND